MLNFFSTSNFGGLALMSAFFGAVATILARTLLKDLKSREIIGISFLTMAAMLLLFSPYFYRFVVSAGALMILSAVVLIDTAANYFYFKTFEETEASVASPILSLAPGFTFLLGWLVLHEHTSLPTYLAATAIILLTLIFSIDFKNVSKFTSRSLFPALLSSVLFGVSAIPSKILLSTLDAMNAPTLYMFRASAIALLSLLFFRFPIRALTIPQYRTITIRGLFVIAQWLLLYFALTSAHAGVTITLANITPIFVFLLSIIFLRETPTFKKLIAAILILLFTFVIV